MIERRNGGIKLLTDKSRQAIQLTDRPQPYLVLVHLPLLGFQVVGEELHQRINLVLGTIPVLDGEGVKSEVADTKRGGATQHRADRLCTTAMPLDSRQATLPRPTTVSIHDNGNVCREDGLGLFTEFCFGVAH